MSFFINLLTEKIPEWNSEQLQESFFHSFCDDNDILVIQSPLRYGVKAMLWFVESEYVITVNSLLDPNLRLFGMWHEIGHFILHSPNRTVGSYFWGDEKIYKGKRKEENEADVFALCALIPKSWVETKTLRELIEDDLFTQDIVVKRKQVYEKYNL